MPANLAETPFIVGTCLLLLGRAHSTLLTLGVAVHTVSFSVARARLLVKSANWDLGLIPLVQVITFIAPSASRTHVVHTNELLSLAFVNPVVQAGCHGCSKVDAGYFGVAFQLVRVLKQLHLNNYKRY